jgi:hypothetical protein
MVALIVRTQKTKKSYKLFIENKNPLGRLMECIKMNHIYSERG